MSCPELPRQIQRRAGLLRREACNTWTVVVVASISQLRGTPGDGEDEGAQAEQEHPKMITNIHQRPLSSLGPRPKPRHIFFLEGISP